MQVISTTTNNNNNNNSNGNGNSNLQKGLCWFLGSEVFIVEPVIF